MEEACHCTHSLILYIIHLLTLFFACEEPWGGEVAADPRELQEFRSLELDLLSHFLVLWARVILPLLLVFSKYLVFTNGREKSRSCFRNLQQDFGVCGEVGL